MSKKDKGTIYYRAWDNELEERGGKQILRLPKKVVEGLEKKHYGVFGHSGVQICGWTKKSIRNQGVCYKEKFYGVDSHRCMEFSPAVMWCQENCSFCWRPMEFMKNIEIDPDKVDEPKEIIDNLLEKRKKLLHGFKDHNVDKKTVDEIFSPSHFAISLSGEATLYPKLDEMIGYLKNMKTTKSVFLVTNGQEPSYFENIENPPTQLYISLEAPNKEIFDSINRSLHNNGWERLNKSLELLSKIDTRKVIRFTQIKGLNDTKNFYQNYKELFDKARADFIEIKAFMHLGNSQMRHTKEEMPEFEEVLDFSKNLAEYTQNYDVVDAIPNSRIVLLKRKDTKYSVELE